MFIQSPHYNEYLERRRNMIADYKRLMKNTESKHEANELKRQMALDLSDLEEDYRSM